MKPMPSIMPNVINIAITKDSNHRDWSFCDGRMVDAAGIAEH
jgi:hypothetical protein